MINRLLQIIRLSERLFIAALLLAVILISGFDVLLRLLFEQGLSWSAPVLKIALLWLSLLGALLAAGSNEHIRIDVLEHYLPSKWYAKLQVLTGFISAAVCFLIAYYAYKFVAETYAYQDMIFTYVPAWITQAIIPLSFALMGLRFFLQAIMPSRLNNPEAVL